MKKKLAPHVIELTQDACLSAFWRKTALVSFLRVNQVSQNYLANWIPEESKRQYLTRLFYDLINLKNNDGHYIILEIARSLSNMTSFPYLENWDDATQKLDKARKSIHRLKNEIDKIDKLLIDEKEKKIIIERERAKREEIQQANQSLNNLSDELKKLCTQFGEQKAGYDFEKWFYALAVYSEMDARPSFKDSNGRQIDGSLTIDGTTFLIETKFTKDPIGSDDIDSFYSKIMRKADNTMGIMISISGYNENAIKNASRDRTPILLLDHSHIFNFILTDVMSLEEVIGRVKRHASQTGKSFLPVNKFSG